MIFMFLCCKIYLRLMCLSKKITEKYILLLLNLSFQVVLSSVRVEN